MKRAFDANVSRAKPRTRLGRAFAEAAEVVDEEREPASAELPAPPVPPESDAALQAIRDEAHRRIAVRQRAPAPAPSAVPASEPPASVVTCRPTIFRNILFL